MLLLLFWSLINFIHVLYASDITAIHSILSHMAIFVQSAGAIIGKAGSNINKLRQNVSICLEYVT